MKGHLLELKGMNGHLLELIMHRDSDILITDFVPEL